MRPLATRQLITLHRMLATLGVLVVATLASATEAEAQEARPQFSFPLACTVGEDCWVLQYVDHDPGPGWRDYACNKRSYDGHTGTDIALRDVASMKAGVPVLAAADGVVVALRDGVPDQKVQDPSDPEIRKIGCGNVVVLAHGDGWRSSYCHMKNGSPTVKEGDRVARGQKVGEVGLSGLTAFPHLEFNVVHGRSYVDPFQGLTVDDPKAAETCGVGEKALWTPEALDRVAYRPVDARLMAFLPRQPDPEQLFQGVEPLTRIAPGTQPLVLTMQLIGVRAGDRAEITVEGPRGRLSRQAVDFPSDKILVTMSLPLGDGPWAEGTYRADLTVTRAGGGPDSKDGGSTFTEPKGAPWSQTWSRRLDVKAAP